MSRAGRIITVNPSKTAVERVGGGPGLMPGDRVKMARGDAEVLGEYRGYLWYRVDGEESGAWYWTKEETKDLVHFVPPTNWNCPVCTFENPVRTNVSLTLPLTSTPTQLTHPPAQTRTHARACARTHALPLPLPHSRPNCDTHTLVERGRVHHVWYTQP